MLPTACVNERCTAESLGRRVLQQSEELEPGYRSSFEVPARVSLLKQLQRPKMITHSQVWGSNQIADYIYYLKIDILYFISHFYVQRVHFTSWIRSTTAQDCYYMMFTTLDQAVCLTLIFVFFGLSFPRHSLNMPDLMLS